jgi:hypothetical protein
LEQRIKALEQKKLGARHISFAEIGRMAREIAELRAGGEPTPMTREEIERARPELGVLCDRVALI